MLLFLLCILLWCKAASKPPARDIDYELAYELRQRIAVANNSVQHYKETIAKLQQEESEMCNKLWYYEKLGLPHKALKEKHEKLQEKIWSEKQKLSKAELNKISLERRLNKCLSK